MSRFLKNLSSLMNGNANRMSKRGAAEPDAGPSTLTTPLFPLNGGDSDSTGVPQQPPRRHAAGGARSISTEGAEAVPPGALAPPAAQTVLPKAGRKSASRALNAVVRATTQVELSTHVEPTSSPKVARASQRSSVVLTETEKLRLRIMQVQLKLSGLGLFEGTVNGMMSPDLVDGVRHFQTLKGMRDSGLLTTGTLIALGIRPID